jgi:hypothetical protein
VTKRKINKAAVLRGLKVKGFSAQRVTTTKGKRAWLISNHDLCESLEQIASKYKIDAWKDR